jgi:hypothetical protein
VIVYVAFLNEAHRNSCRSVTSLNDARRERGIESSGREKSDLDAVVRLHPEWLACRRFRGRRAFRGNDLA